MEFYSCIVLVIAGQANEKFYGNQGVGFSCPKGVFSFQDFVIVTHFSYFSCNNR